MRVFIRVVLVLFYLLCMVAMYLSMVDKYDVIYDMDSAFPRGALGNGSNNDVVFSGVILLFISLSQMLFFYFEQSKKWKWAAAIMTVLAFLFFFAK
ncbi:hypothetical protein F3J27_06580 [Enterobacter sp. Ap-916]|nr:hypothetical protein [Enterobacter sp. Ap-867]NIG29146.1 hypothetical protein [Enterobacter sp. Ap-916]